MDTTSNDSSDGVPPEFQTILLASTTYIQVRSTFEQLQGKDAIQKCCIFATSLGHLIEVQDGQVIRSSKLPWKDTMKVVVHFQFQPLHKFVLLLRKCQKAFLLSFDDFKEMYEWDCVEDIMSADEDDIGVPSLSLKLTTGEKLAVPNRKLLSLCNNGIEENNEEERGKMVADTAAAHGLKDGVRYLGELNAERHLKEAFICQKLKVLQSQLEGSTVPEIKNRMMELVIGDCKATETPEPIPSTKPSLSPLQVISVRHKIVHGKWVIGVNVINRTERQLISSPQLSLHVTEGARNLSYTTCILKMVRRLHDNKPNTSKDSDTPRVSIEKLDPPILRPKKRACILGICDLPEFIESSTITCSGIITLTCKPLTMEASQRVEPEKMPTREYQQTFEPVSISAHELNAHELFIENTNVKGGVPFTVVALIAGSMCNRITLTSIVSPLSNLVSKLSNKHKLMKIESVHGLYCLYPGQCHPLKHAVFSCQPQDTHKVDITLYTKDESQALVLIHSMLAVLPSDVSVYPHDINAKENHSQAEKVRHQLLAKMKEVTSSVVEIFESQMEKNKRRKKGSEIEVMDVDEKTKEGRSRNSLKSNTKDEHKEGATTDEGHLGNNKYLEDREACLAGKGDVTFDSATYSVWRKKLYDLQCEMDNMYLQYHE